MSHIFWDLEPNQDLHGQITNITKLSRCIKRGYFTSEKIDVALKYIPLSAMKLNKNHIRRVRNEITSLRIVQGHPNIIRFIGFYITARYIVIVTEFSPHLDLLTYIHTRSFTRSEMKLIFLDLLNAVKHIHSLGIVHRDIKPENFVVGLDGHCKLIDFGFSRQFTHSNCFFQTIDQITSYPPENSILPTHLARKMTTPCGTVDYSPPEILKHEEYDEKCDIWSLGVTLYAIATKKFPWAYTTFSDFDSEDDIKIAKCISNFDIDLISPEHPMGFVLYIFYAFCNLDASKRKDIDTVIEYLHFT